MTTPKHHELILDNVTFHYTTTEVELEIDDIIITDIFHDNISIYNTLKAVNPLIGIFDQLEEIISSYHWPQ